MEDKDIENLCQGAFYMINAYWPGEDGKWMEFTKIGMFIGQTLSMTIRKTQSQKSKSMMCYRNVKLRFLIDEKVVRIDPLDIKSIFIAGDAQ